jgi:hypothetical protein
MFNTPAGKISPINSINMITLVGVCSAGLTTYNLLLKPERFSKLALTLEFQGMISPTTPIGSCKTMLKVFFVMLRILPSSARITPAK